MLNNYREDLEIYNMMCVRERHRERETERERGERDDGERKEEKKESLGPFI